MTLLFMFNVTLPNYIGVLKHLLNTRKAYRSSAMYLLMMGDVLVVVHMD